MLYIFYKSIRSVIGRLHLNGGALSAFHKFDWNFLDAGNPEFLMAKFCRRFYITLNKISISCTIWTIHRHCNEVPADGERFWIKQLEFKVVDSHFAHIRDTTSSKVTQYSCEPNVNAMLLIGSDSEATSLWETHFERRMRETSGIGVDWRDHIKRPATGKSLMT